MKNTKIIKIYLVDNDQNELEKFRDTFKPEFQYILYTFSSVQMFLNKLKSDSKNNEFKIVLLEKMVHSRGMQTNSALEILPKIKSIDREIEVLILASSENIELKATSSNLKSVIYINKDEHFYDKLYPALSRIISDYELKKRAYYLKISLIITFLIILTAIIFFIIGIYFYDKL